MSSSFKKISVVMACYNSAAYLNEAISSILNQSFYDFEFIIVDDGSSDNTLNIIHSYASKDRRIKYHVGGGNMGPASARNTGIELANGKWIAILDSDDIALPHRLECQIKYAESHRDTVMLGSDSFSINIHGRITRSHHFPNNHSALLKRLEKHMGFPPHSSVIYRTESIRKVGGFNKRFLKSQDWDLWLRLSGHGKIESLQVPLVEIRKHDSSLSAQGAGRAQALFGTAATVCHFLRSTGVADPSNSSEAYWQRFIGWLSWRLDEIGFYQRDTETRHLKQHFYEKGFQMMDTWYFPVTLERLKLYCRIAKQKMFGTDYALKLADEWMRIPCAVL